MAKANVPKHFLGAFKRGHRMNSKEFIDDEFSQRLLDRAQRGDKEAEAALLWLARFNNEFHKDLIRKGDKAALHNTDELRRDCHRRNNVRRRDLFTAADRVAVTAERLDVPTGPVEHFFPASFFNKKLKK